MFDKNFYRIYSVILKCGILFSFFLSLLACNHASSLEEGTIHQVTIKTDKQRYNKGQTVRMTISNQSEQKTYIWTGTCSFTLERHNGNAWEASPTLWSGCPLCGHQREIPHPLFLGPAATEEIEWDQIVTWCEEGVIRTELAVGRFRFAFSYAEDKPGCRSTPDPLNCWMSYRDKKWQRAYSNEFSIIEHSDM